MIHLHHGVWLSNGNAGAGEGNGYVGGFYPFMASGEEKTIYEFPSGYGYPIGANDAWYLNYMIHDLTGHGGEGLHHLRHRLHTGDVSAGGRTIKPVHPIWMDVEAHHIYPVFDVQRCSGENGKYTFPDMANNPYGNGPPLNVFTVDHPGTLVGTAGHVHPGGLYDDLDLIRVRATAERGRDPGHSAQLRAPVPLIAHYFDQRGPISWDMAMTATPADWRPQVNAGDVLRISATYETKRASWYESMGIMVVWEAWDDTRGVDPFTHALDQNGHVTHGHLAENDHHGGSARSVSTSNKFPTCRTNKVIINGSTTRPATSRRPARTAASRRSPEGQSLTFVNNDAYPDGKLNLFDHPNPELHPLDLPLRHVVPVPVRA